MKKGNGRYVEIKYYENGKMELKIPKLKGMVPVWIQYPVAISILMKTRNNKEFEKLVWKNWDKVTKMVKEGKLNAKKKTR